MKALAAILILTASMAGAQDVTPPTKSGPFDVEAYTWTQLVLGRGMERPSHVFGARAEGSVSFAFMTCGTRLDASATKDGVTIENPDTWSTLESYTYCAAKVLPIRFGDVSLGSVSLIGIWGETTPQWGQEGERQRTRVVGLTFGSLDTWLLIGVGDHESVGRGRRLVVAWKIKAQGAAYVVGDFAAGDSAILGANWRLRGGLGVKVLK